MLFDNIGYLLLSSALNALAEGIVDGLAALTGHRPDNTGAIEVVYDSGIGDLVDADGVEIADPVASAQARNRAVEQIRQCGRSYAE